eukprot:5195478-Pleurochrysis_carterae.AAC.1
MHRRTCWSHQRSCPRTPARVPGERVFSDESNFCMWESIAAPCEEGVGGQAEAEAAWSGGLTLQQSRDARRGAAWSCSETSASWQ